VQYRFYLGFFLSAIIKAKLPLISESKSFNLGKSPFQNLSKIGGITAVSIFTLSLRQISFQALYR
jgi:hypothetical protein